MEFVVWLAGSLVNALILGFLSRRLLGAPVGWPRTIILSLVVSSLAVPVVTSVWTGLGLGPDTPSDHWVVVSLVTGLVLAWVVVIQVIIMVIAEAFVPTGSVPGPIQLIRSIPSRRQRSRRYLEIIAILAKHGLTGYLRPRRPTRPTSRVAVEAREAMTEAGVTFVKLGQTLATRPDLVSAPFAAEFAALHSTVPAESWDTVRPVVESELGCRIEDVFADIDPKPLAAASVAQIHAATLLDGTAVVIKVQRPRARAQVEADLDIMGHLAQRLERTTPWGRSLGLVGLAEGFSQSLKEELDYRVEIANMQAVAAASDLVRIPTPYPELSGRRLLVMERLDGQPLSAAGQTVAARSAEERETMAQDLFTAVLRQVMVSGVFHADLHPGNIFVLSDGSLALLDFGSVGRLDRSARQTLGMLLLAADRGDAIAATDALLELLDRPADLEDRRLERQVGQLLLRYGGGLGQSGSADLFADLINLVVAHRFAIPPAIAAAFRALGSLEGSLTVLTDGLDLVASARAQGQELLAEQLQPEAVRREIEGQVAGWLPMVQRLPRRIDQLGAQLEDGRMTVGVRLFGRPDEREFLTSIVHQLVLAVLAAALAICGVLLLVAPGGPVLLAALSLFQLLGAMLLLFAFTLGARVLVLVFRQPTASG